MKKYHIKPDYLSQWGEDTTTETVVTLEEIERLSAEWETPIEELLTELEEI